MIHSRTASRHKSSGERARLGCWRRCLAFANSYLKGNQRRMLRRGAAINTRDGCAPQSKTRGAASYELIPIEVEVFDLFFCKGSCASCDSLTLAGDTPAATTLGSAPVSGAGGVVSTARTSDEQRIREKKVRRRETQRPTRETCMRPIQCARYGGISRGRDHRSRLQLVGIEQEEPTHLHIMMRQFVA